MSPPLFISFFSSASDCFPPGCPSHFPLHRIKNKWLNFLCLAAHSRSNVSVSQYINVLFIVCLPVVVFISLV